MGKKRMAQQTQFHWCHIAPIKKYDWSIDYPIVRQTRDQAREETSYTWRVVQEAGVKRGSKKPECGLEYE